MLSFLSTWSFASRTLCFIVGLELAKALYEGCLSVIKVVPSTNLPSKAFSICCSLSLFETTAFKYLSPFRCTAVTTCTVVI